MFFYHEPCRQAAEPAAWFVLKHLPRKEVRLLRRYREGAAAYPAKMDDYVFLVRGLIELYDAALDASLLETAICWTQERIDLCWDTVYGGLFFTKIGNAPLVARSKDVYNGCLPYGNSVVLLNLLRRSRMMGNKDRRFACGGPGGNRTLCPLLRNQPVYML